jgi:hypothetical protein
LFFGFFLVLDQPYFAILCLYYHLCIFYLFFFFKSGFIYHLWLVFQFIPLEINGQKKKKKGRLAFLSNRYALRKIDASHNELHYAQKITKEMLPFMAKNPCVSIWMGPTPRKFAFFLSCPWLPKMNHFKPLLRSTACLTRRSVHSTAIVRTETEAATQRKLT